LFELRHILIPNLFSSSFFQSLFLFCPLFCLPLLCLISFFFSARAARLRAANVEAEKSAAELKKQLEQDFKNELASKDAGDTNFSKQLKETTAKEQAEIDKSFDKNQKDVVDFLLSNICAVNLEVSEALRQSLLTKAEQGTQ